MNITIEDLGLSSRAYNCMVRAGYKKASDLAGITIKDLKNIRNLGNRTVNEIVGKLVMYGVEIPEK